MRVMQRKTSATSGKVCIILFLCIFTIYLMNCSSYYSSLTVRHSPLYKPMSHESTISATAKCSAGIKQVELTIIKGKMVDRLKLVDPPSVIPLRKNAVTFKKIFKYPTKPKEVTAEYKENFGSQALISYEAKVITGSGEVLTSDEITFTAGFVKAPGYPFSPTDIRPIYWHRQEDMDAKIDICFFPDKDYNGVYSSFTEDIEDLMELVYFSYGKDTPITKDFGHFLPKVYGGIWRKFFNLWAAPFGADVYSTPCFATATVSTINSVVDGGVIVHLTQLKGIEGSDWGTLSLGGHGTVSSPKMVLIPGMTSDAFSSSSIFLHESGHFLHGLSDEYEDAKGYKAISKYPNVFTSKTDCESAAQKHGFDLKKVGPIPQTVYWHLNEVDEIMGSCGMGSSKSEHRFYHFCNLSVLYRFGQCVQGQCY